MEFLSTHYLWLKAFHIIFVISWMAGLFYLPRLFAYHAREKKGSAQSETFKIMERRLMKIIMNPAMVGTFFFGLLMISVPGALDWTTGWIHLKLVLVLGMAGFHGYLSQCRRLFSQDKNGHSEKFYRTLNEVGPLLMIVIVILAIVKPF